MVKKVALWIVYLLIVVLLVFGAANRTSAKTDQGILFGNMDAIIAGRGRADAGVGNYVENSNSDVDDHEELLAEHDWVSLSGQIITVGIEALEIQTGESEILEIEGRTWRYIQELGYTPIEGNEVVVKGFYENGEFEAASFEDLTAGLIFQIRDKYGKPMWGGGGRN